MALRTFLRLRLRGTSLRSFSRPKDLALAAAPPLLAIIVTMEGCNPDYINLWFLRGRGLGM